MVTDFWLFWKRVNISNAVLFGLQQDLDIQTGTKYNAALTIFFVPYIILEVGNLELERGRVGADNMIRSHRTSC